MLIAKIEGATRICGEAQGYRGLPLRDELITEAVNGPGTPAMVTAWTPTPAERDRAIADLRDMLTSDQRSKSVPATGLQ